MRKNQRAGRYPSAASSVRAPAAPSSVHVSYHRLPPPTGAMASAASDVSFARLIERPTPRRRIAGAR